MSDVQRKAARHLQAEIGIPYMKALRLVSQGEQPCGVVWLPDSSEWTHVILFRGSRDDCFRIAEQINSYVIAIEQETDDLPNYKKGHAEVIRLDGGSDNSFPDRERFIATLADVALRVM